MSIKAIVLSAATLTCSLSMAAPGAPATPYDPLVASFERMLAPATTPATVSAERHADVDPLRTRLSAVLWTEPSYHLPMRVVQLTLPSRPLP